MFCSLSVCVSDDALDDSLDLYGDLSVDMGQELTYPEVSTKDVYTGDFCCDFSADFKRDSKSPV